MKYVVQRIMQHVLKSAEEGGLGYQENQIILSGISMGTGPSTMLASQHPGVKGLMLEAPYTSMRDISKSLLRRASMFLYFPFHFWPLELLGNLMAHHFNSLENMKEVRCPVQIIHGEKDRLIDIE